jgi:di/tricarboxylate transporter
MEVAAAVIVAATLAAMTSGRIEPVLALVSGLVLAGLVGIAPADALFAGLANAGVITVAGMLVIAEGVVATGIVSRASWRLLAGVEGARQAFRRLAPPVAVASSLMNTTPLVAMLIAATRELEQTRRVPARGVLLPIAHATTLVGSVTLIGTSSNLVIAGIASDRGVDMSMLSFAPVALPVALAGWVVIYLTMTRLGSDAEATAASPLREWRAEIPIGAPALVDGHRAAELGVAATDQFRLAEVRRDGGAPLAPDVSIAAGDLLVYEATEEGVRSLWRSPVFGIPAQRLYAITVRTDEGGLLGGLEQDGSLRVIAARTDQALHETAVLPGATCYVTGVNADAIAQHDAVGLWQAATSHAPQPRKTLIALGVLACVVGAALAGLAPVELAASGGAVVMVLTGVLTPRAAVRALDLRTLFILAGSIGLGAIVVESGLAGSIADAIRSTSDGHPAPALIVLAVTTALMTNFVTNGATASILTPVAIAVAGDLAIDPVTVLALIGTCVSFTFVNPISHQTNLMVLSPGGYTQRTFALYGVPLLAGALVTACGVAYLLST